MFSGKAVARSLRAHMLVQGALVGHLINALVDEGKIDPLQLESVYKKAIMTGLKKDELIEFGDGDVFSHIEKMISEYTLTKKDASRTAKLWLLYMNYVSIVKKFLIAERTSNWCLHIQAVTKMMNLFAASGHLHYAKSFRIYVQEMLTMSETNSWLYHQFQEGQHDVRRSGRFWAGLWSDLVIEQTLMRSIKSSGGLTRGRGFEENVRHLWVSSISYTAAVHEAMSSLSGVKASSSEQHAEMEFKRRSRDYQDCEKFFSWFESRNPFNFEDADLHSLSTGSVSVCGTDNVNCENAESIGECIQKSIDEVNFTEAKIKKKDQLCNLNMMTSSIKIERKNHICVNPTLLFTRLAAIAQREEDVEQYFDFELTTRPQSLFKNELMRKPDKASLRKVLLTEEIQCSANEVMEITGKYVLDGGALLHRVHWVKGIKFNEVAKAYVNYIRRNYGSAFIVFDGYDSPESIKSNEHLRRAGSKGSTPNIIITEDNEVPYTKERFLSNSHNKTQLISFLADHLTLDGQAVHICRGDADTKIVSTALEVANDSTTIVVADDTDVAVMLLYHWNENISDVFFLQERGKKCWSIRKAQLEVLDFKEHLLFIHAWSGCDSTSAIFGKGKSSFLNLVKKSKIIQLVSETICDYWATQSDVGDASRDLEDIEMSDDDTDGEDGERNIFEDLFSVNLLSLLVEFSLHKRSPNRCILMKIKSPFYTTIHGLEHCPVAAGYADLNLFRSGLEYAPRDSDIFIVSYPKSGTTWMQMIVWLLLNDLEPPKYIDQLIDDNFLEYFAGKEGVSKMKEPRQIKSHLPFDLIPFNPKAKYIHVCRNPFDVEFGDYYSHLSSWYEQSHPNILFVTFEEMKENIKGVVENIVKFIGGEIEARASQDGFIDKILGELEEEITIGWKHSAGGPPFGFQTWEAEVKADQIEGRLLRSLTG
ncbi:Sulfotransferase family cytosolic 2B member 1 [Nymphon striatum]|nr:Sulfotransferase family cytosolic 2B member 1 [Nymphon striatum]